ncbi:MAG: hypothetical protein JWQ30_2114, partial [Sediminibacterium sp.]|nr:hypothetical protein [Sediminibacterium sp.]
MDGDNFLPQTTQIITEKFCGNLCRL